MNFTEINAKGHELLGNDNYEEAYAHYNYALEHIEEISGIRNEEIGQLWNNLGLSLRFLGDDMGATKAYENALKLYRECDNISINEIAVTLSNLGMCALSMGDDEKAWDYLTEELDLRKSQLSANPNQLDVPKMAWCLHNLAEIFCRRKEFDKALQNLEQALAIRQNALPEGHDDIAENLKMMADIYYTIDNKKLSKKYYKLALPMYKRILGNEHDLVKDIENQLKELKSFLGKLFG